jgi:hypothetical protein
VPGLIARLNDSDYSVRAKACLALRLIQISDKDIGKVVRALGRKLSWSPASGWNESEAVIRYEAAVSLRRFAEDASEVIPALIDGTRDKKSWEMRHMCVGTLWRAAFYTKDKTDPRAVRALIALLNNRNSTYQERLEVVIGLGSLAKSTDPAIQRSVVEALLNAATSNRVTSNRPLSIWAYAGLVVHANDVGAKRALVAIARYLKPEHELETRIQAAQAIGALGDKAKRRLPDILAMLKDKETLIVAGACQALIRMGNRDDKVIDALLAVAGHKEVNRAASAVLALASLKVNTSKVIDTLQAIADKEKAKKGKESNLALINLITLAIEHIKKPDKKPAKVVAVPEKAEKVKKVRNPRK